MLTQNDRSDLKIAMQAALLEQSQVVTESVVMENYIKQEATYEQLLNLCFNGNRADTYMESAILEDVARDYVLEMVYGDAPEVVEPTTAQDKYEVLESILYEGAATDKIKDAFSTAKEKVKGAAATAKEKAKAAPGAAVEKTKKGGEALRQKGLEAKYSEKGGKVKKAVGSAVAKAGKTIADNPKAAMGAAAAATAVGAWYLYRKLRKQGVDKKKAARAAAIAAEKKAAKTGSDADKKSAAKWRKRAA